MRCFQLPYFFLFFIWFIFFVDLWCNFNLDCTHTLLNHSYWTVDFGIISIQHRIRHIYIHNTAVVTVHCTVLSQMWRHTTVGFPFPWFRVLSRYCMLLSAELDSMWRYRIEYRARNKFPVYIFVSLFWTNKVNKLQKHDIFLAPYHVVHVTISWTESLCPFMYRTACILPPILDRTEQVLWVWHWSAACLY